MIKPSMIIKTHLDKCRQSISTQSQEKVDCVLEFLDTKNKLVDIFTKPLNKDSFYTIRRELGLLDASDLTK